MALDGMFLHHIKNEIETHALNSRVDKIYQPNKEEIVLSLRNKDGLHKLLISARANSPRIHFQKHQIENPQTPPMFCMLLRKKLSSAKLIKILQTDLERVLFLNFECINELGDHENLSLVVEIMGKYSNIILLNENGTIVDSLKRVNAEMSSKRLILPGIKYQLPPSQDKFCLLNENIDKILDKITNQPKTEHLNKTLLKTLQGVSPIICREIEFYVGNGMTVVNDEITHDEKTKLRTALKSLKDTVSNFDGNPYMISDQSDSPFDVTFIKPKQYADSALIKKFESFSELLDDFYFEKDVKERMRSKSQDLLKKLNNLNERLSKKINLQKKELLSCSDREKFRVWADVINANIYSIEKGSTEVELQNFYDENQNFIKIKLDPSLSAARNAQKYYKKYQKLKTAESVLNSEIKKAVDELSYIETVLDELSRIKNEQELLEVKEELISQGYLKRSRKVKTKKIKESAPIEELSSDGFRILIGKNNRQNDKLTLKLSNKNSLWFHTKNIPGSHVIIPYDGNPISETAIFEAAKLAAKHSKACNSSQVPVDYTKVKNVSKPNGAKPGMVIYVNYKTIYVTP